MSSPDRRPRAVRALAPAALVAAALAGCTAGGPVVPSAADAGRYGLGRAPTADEVRGWDIDIGPDGSNLPPGSGTVAQGRALYQAQCVSCHGDRGQGALMAAPLAGGAGTLTARAPVMTIGSFWPHATTLFDYVRRAMPFNAPQSLKPDEVYALTAFLLHLNGVVGPDAVMDARAVTAVRMPNRGGFVPGDATPDVRAVRCMRDCR